MTSKSLKNPFDDYSTSAAVCFSDEKGCMPGVAFKEQLRTAENALRKKLKTHEAEIFSNPTVYTGSAGIALLHFLYGMKNPENAYENFLKASRYLNFSKLDKQRPSFLCGDAGPLAIGAAISYKMGTKKPKDIPDFRELVKLIVQLEPIANKTKTPNELLYGRAGYLYALLFTQKHTKQDAIPPDLISRVAHSIIQAGRALSKEKKANVPLMWEWHDKAYLGAAHGTAGILYMLLMSRDYIDHEATESLIIPTIDGLLDLCYESGNLPSSLGSSGGDRLVQWCHGAPGLVQLCVLAYDLFKVDRYYAAALKCGEVVWIRGLTAKGYSICHGVAGNAYTFLRLYQATKDPKHLYRACCFAKWCFDRKPGTESHSPDRKASLFEGLSGQLFLLHDIRDPAAATFPGYDI